jgi:glycerol uptake operon antiterminator
LSLLYRFSQKPIIAALRKPEEVQEAIESQVDHIFFMGGSVTQVLPAVAQAKQAGKGVFIHVDLIRGLSSTSKETIEFIANYMKADGIVTPKHYLVKEAQKNGLHAILHIFVLDSMSLDNGLKMIAESNPDAVELMPGAVTKVIRQCTDVIGHIPFIASGLIQTKEEAVVALEKSLWRMNFSDLGLDG